MAAARSRRRSEGEDRREELLAAAERVLVRDGVAATTTRRIAEEAGVPLGTVHYWFASKDELLGEVFRRLVAGLDAAVAHSGADLRATLAELWRLVVSDSRDRQLTFYELTTYSLRTPGSEGLALEQYTTYRVLAERMLRSWAEGRPGIPEAQVAIVAQLGSALFDGLVLAWLADPEGTEPDAALDLFAEAIVRALAPGPAGKTERDRNGIRK